VALVAVATLGAGAITAASPVLAGEPAAAPTASPVPADAEVVHDHAPRHGGAVAMSGTRHLEAMLQPDGLLRVHVSDLHRKPLPVDGAKGSATVPAASGPVTVPLGVRGETLEAVVPAPPGSLAEVRVEVTLRDGEHLLVDFTLPVAPASHH